MPPQPQEHDHLWDLLSMASIKNKFPEICQGHKCYHKIQGKFRGHNTKIKIKERIIIVSPEFFSEFFKLSGNN
jgi:hypothetical protein